MAWFQKKPPRRRVDITQSLENDTRSNGAILEGDANATTPVEARNLAKLAHLPPFSPVAINLIRLFDREDTDIAEIVRLVQSDPALTTETLAYVNSPLLGLQETITDLKHAIAVLGADRTKSLATTLAMRSMLNSAPKLGVVRRVWQHCIATAVIAADLAPAFLVNPDLAYTAGVLHDVGRIGLLAQYGDHYGHIVLSSYENVPAILQAEREFCALDHCDVGMYLGQVWNLPTVLQEVMAQHHRAKGRDGLLGLIHTSCAMADDLNFWAIAHRGTLTAEERIAECVPPAVRERVKASWAGFEERIWTRVNQLDF